MMLHTEGQARLQGFGHEVAAECGFPYVPPISLRRGGGGAWFPSRRVIRIGSDELQAPPERLWFVLAHELAHAQAPSVREGHSHHFWVRLAEGLEQAGKLELLRYDFGYREGALDVARQYGLSNVPPKQGFSFDIGDSVVDKEGGRWSIQRRYRHRGRPCYDLKRLGWHWTRLTEDHLLAVAR